MLILASKNSLSLFLKVLLTCFVLFYMTLLPNKIETLWFMFVIHQIKPIFKRTFFSVWVWNRRLVDISCVMFLGYFRIQGEFFCNNRFIIVLVPNACICLTYMAYPAPYIWYIYILLYTIWCMLDYTYIVYNINYNCNTRNMCNI